MICPVVLSPFRCLFHRVSGTTLALSEVIAAVWGTGRKRPIRNAGREAGSGTSLRLHGSLRFAEINRQITVHERENATRNQSNHKVGTDGRIWQRAL